MIECSFLLAPTKKMCYKIVSNFVHPPHKEREKMARRKQGKKMLEEGEKRGGGIKRKIRKINKNK